MKFAVFTVSTPDYTPDEAATVLSEIGYDGVEWRVTDQAESAEGKPGFWASNRCTWPLATFEQDAPRIKDLTERAGLEMPGLGTYPTCDNLSDVEKAMKGAAALGVSQLRINVPNYDGSSSYIAIRDRSLSQYHDVAAMARQYGLRALVEIHHKKLLPSASAAASFVSTFDPAEVGVIHDAGNMVYEGHEAYRLGLEVLGPYLALIHLKNAQWLPGDAGPHGGTRWNATWAPVPHGIVDVPALFAAMRQVGYNGWVCLEDFSTVQPLRERLRDNLAYVKAVAEE
jgi:sugar phosphate isomerase/epimerase